MRLDEFTQKPILNEVTWFERSPLIAKLKEHAHKGRWVHFSPINKIGVNPNKDHLDPHGVYFYPVDYVVNDFEIRMTHGTQYAVNHDFYFIVDIKPWDNVLDLGSLTMEEAYALADRNGWGKLFRKKVELSGTGMEPGYLFWKSAYSLIKSGGEITWGQVLRDVWIVNDTEGNIHFKEPEQALVRNPRCIRVIDSGANPDKFSGMDNTFSIGYWKSVINDVFPSIAAKFNGTFYWHNKLPIVKIPYQGIDFYLKMESYSALQLFWRKDRPGMKRLDSIDLEELDYDEIEDEITKEIRQVAQKILAGDDDLY